MRLDWEDLGIGLRIVADGTPTDLRRWLSSINLRPTSCGANTKFRDAAVWPSYAYFHDSVGVVETLEEHTTSAASNAVEERAECKDLCDHVSEEINEVIDLAQTMSQMGFASRPEFWDDVRCEKEIAAATELLTLLGSELEARSHSSHLWRRVPNTSYCECVGQQVHLFFCEQGSEHLLLGFGTACRVEEVKSRTHRLLKK